MNKPDMLRSLIADTLPFFKTQPDRLQLFISNGAIRCTNAESLSFQYEYELELVVEDYPAHPDTLIVPVLAFLKRHQNELLANPDKQKIVFEVEHNNNQTHDLYLKLPLTERVVVREDNGNYEIQHAAEPQRPDWQRIERLQLFVKGKLMFDSEKKQDERQHPATDRRP